MLFSSLSACVLLLSSGATALRHVEPDNGLAEPLWAAPHVAHHQDQHRDGVITARGKRSSHKAHLKLHARQPPPPPPPGPPPPPPPPGSGAPPKWQKPSTPPEPVKVKVDYLWRGENFRLPADVREAGGFASHAKRIFEGTHPAYKSGMTPEVFAKGSSLYQHAVKTCSCSSYVSMSTSPEEAKNFASKLTAKKTFVYKIRPEINKVVDVTGSVGEGNLNWVKEKEIAGVYEVPWSRVLGWYEGTPTKVDGGGSEIKYSEFINKRDVYPTDKLPEEGALSGEFEIHSELAGFSSGQTGYNELPWMEYKEKPVEEWLNQYMLERNFNNKEAEFKAARKAEEFAKLACPSQRRKRAGASEACELVNKQNSESPAEEGVKEPISGEEVTKPGIPEEGVKVPPAKGEKTPSELGVSAKLAEEISEKEFTQLAAKRGLDVLAKEKFQMSLSQFRNKIKYEPLKPTSPKIGAGGFKPPSITGGAVAAVGAAFWVYGVVEAFTTNVTALDRAAAVTSIIPFVGCAVGAAAAVEKDDFDGVDVAMCFLGDALLLSPLWPVGILVHVVRAIMSLFKPPKEPTLEEFQGRRDRIWARFLRDDIYTYIYSHESYQNVTGHPHRADSKTFREKLEASLAIEELAVLSEGARFIGMTSASAQDDLKATPERKEEITKGIEDASEKLRQATAKEVVRRQRQLVMNLPKQLQEKHVLSLQPMAKQYNDDFIESITNEKMVAKYRKVYPGDPKVSGSERDDSAEVRAKLKGWGDKLRANPPALPRYFELAYIIGQSRSLLAVDNATLSVPDYIRDKAPSLSETAVQLQTIHHTLQIARLLNGKITEDELSKESPTKDAAGARDLQTLVALKYGRVYDVYKFKWASSMFKGATALFPDKQIPGVEKFLIQPQVPPVPVGTEDFENTHLYVSLVSGLSEAIVDTLKDNADAMGKKREVGIGKAIMDLAQKLQGTVGKTDAKWEAAVAAFRKDTADPNAD